MRTVKIPAFEFQFNLVVYPNSHASVSCFNFDRGLKQYILFLKENNSFFILKNNGAKPVPIGTDHWLSLMPGYVYCFVPSFEAYVGEVHVYSHMPEFINNFQFCMEIEKVLFAI